MRDKVTSTPAAVECGAGQFVEATADFTRVAASADEAKAGEAALTQNWPENAWRVPMPPDTEKYASSPIPLTALPAFAASFAAARAVGPGLEMAMSIVIRLV